MIGELRIRKTAVFVEALGSDEYGSPNRGVCRGYAAAVVDNPCLNPGCLSDGEKAGEVLGQLLTGKLLLAMQFEEGTMLSYGKAAIVGLDGSLEHAASILHPRMGKPLRKLIGQGKAIIPSTVKRGSPGVHIDIPLHYADNEWDFSGIDTLEAFVNDAPLPREIIVFVALACGGRFGVNPIG